jgi:serine/threonine protein kinase
MCPRNCLLGTPAFMSPEVIAEGRYGHKSDIWALGCTVLAMLTGCHNLYDQMSSPMAIIYNVGQLKLKPNVPTWCSESTIDFLNQCFTSNWELRPDASDLLDHEFMVQPITTSRSPPPGYYATNNSQMTPSSSNAPGVALPDLGITKSSINWTGTRDASEAGVHTVVQDPHSTLTHITDLLKSVPHAGFAPLKKSRSSASVHNTPTPPATPTPPKFATIRLPPLQQCPLFQVCQDGNSPTERRPERIPSMDSIFTYLTSLGERMECCKIFQASQYASLFNIPIPTLDEPPLSTTATTNTNVESVFFNASATPAFLKYRLQEIHRGEASYDSLVVPTLFPLVELNSDLQSSRGFSRFSAGSSHLGGVNRLLRTPAK